MTEGPAGTAFEDQKDEAEKSEEEPEEEAEEEEEAPAPDPFVFAPNGNGASCVIYKGGSLRRPNVIDRDTPVQVGRRKMAKLEAENFRMKRKIDELEKEIKKVSALEKRTKYLEDCMEALLGEKLGSY
ncbi:uncharacterized protein BDZ99DRAFT_479695 [Mytilinidion resinicola]|uniref:Uncharacterized protein n=1 Tax=Mytilinidion resinicola TaxID=574789 RepID=A0A6A6YD51_9PEZI|nr:uncharacterized protein BDZ99DRAFT_479695 [Mytilinidion resinicola]KAF2806443.1 hypothetical protein BDZ99DRAFT_479695 [Mytilinidion resinicola]